MTKGEKVSTIIKSAESERTRRVEKKEKRMDFNSSELVIGSEKRKEVLKIKREKGF